MTIICACCERLSGTPRAKHDDGFIDTRTGLEYCAECVSQLVSWELDGGALDAPELFAWAQPEALGGEP